MAKKELVHSFTIDGKEHEIPEKELGEIVNTLMFCLENVGKRGIEIDELAKAVEKTKDDPGFIYGLFGLINKHYLLTMIDSKTKGIKYFLTHKYYSDSEDPCFGCMCKNCGSDEDDENEDK